MADCRIAESFAAFIRRKGGDEVAVQAATAAVAALQEGEIAIPIERLKEAGITLPESSTFIGAGGEYKPLIVEHGLIYLYRYWQHESLLAERLNSLARKKPEYDINLLKIGLEREFPGAETDDRQKLAAICAVAQRFCVISGGPGTGKSTTVKKIMTLLQDQLQGERFRILLAAPTGKAAGRLKQILSEDNGAPSVSVATLHRLLGYLPETVRFRHDSSNPLPCELLIVDEASMIPLPLMARLVAALPDSARLILLGDRDQLSSVEPGAVLGDICQEQVLDSFTNEIMETLTECSHNTSTLKSATNPLSDSVIKLERSYRFSGTGGIGRLSRLVNNGAATAALELILHGDEELSYLPLSSVGAKNDQFNCLVQAGFKSYLQETDPLVALRKFDSFRILCAVKNGERGVEGINRRVESLLATAGLIEPDQRWYTGRPVMVTVNDYGLRLYNGDVGIVMADPDLDGALSVYFPDESGGVRRVSPLRLPHHETAYAMTVHKSQGSEFDRVLLLLPAVESQVITRELIYTGITRARRAVIMSAPPEVLVAGIERRVTRNSCLSRRLWGEQVSQN